MRLFVGLDVSRCLRPRLGLRGSSPRHRPVASGQRRNRRCSEAHEPKLSGSSRQDAPVRAIPTTPPSTRRWFLVGGPVSAPSQLRSARIVSVARRTSGHGPTVPTFLPSRGASESASAVLGNYFGNTTSVDVECDSCSISRTPLASKCLAVSSKKTDLLQVLTSNSPNWRSHEVRRISARRDRLRAT